MLTRKRALLALSLCCFGGMPARAQNPVPPATGAAPSPTPVTPSAAPEAASAAQTPAPVPTPPQSSPASGPDVSQLEGELANVLDELIQARTRTSVLVKTLFRTPVEVWVVRRADDQRLAHITLRLDGVPVHDSDGSALSGGEAKLFSGFAAPGLHDLAIEISEESKERSDYRYQRSERFRIEVKKGTKTQIELVLRDRSDMAEELPEGDKGEYDVRTIMRAHAEKVKE
ncbi:MAG: hypothetical protein QM778_12955 [Myxococcales bacterium]